MVPVLPFQMGFLSQLLMVNARCSCSLSMSYGVVLTRPWLLLLSADAGSLPNSSLSLGWLELRTDSLAGFGLQDPHPRVVMGVWKC